MESGSQPLTNDMNSGAGRRVYGQIDNGVRRAHWSGGKDADYVGAHQLNLTALGCAQEDQQWDCVLLCAEQVLNMGGCLEVF